MTKTCSLFLLDNCVPDTVTAETVTDEAITNDTVTNNSVADDNGMTMQSDSLKEAYRKNPKSIQHGFNGSNLDKILGYPLIASTFV